jgi:hypothetical protein
VHIAAKNADSNGELCCECLKLVDQKSTLFLMSTSCIVIIEIVQQIDVSIEAVEETAA